MPNAIRKFRVLALCVFALIALVPAVSAQPAAQVQVNGDGVGPVSVSVNEVVSITGSGFPADANWTWYLVSSYTAPCAFDEGGIYESGTFPADENGEVNSLLTIPDGLYDTPFVGFFMDYGAVVGGTNCVLLEVEGEVAPPTATPTEAPSGQVQMTVNGEGTMLVLPEGAPPPVVSITGLSTSGEFLDVNIYTGFGCEQFFETRFISTGGAPEYAFNQGFEFPQNSIQIDASVSGLTECVNVSYETDDATVAPTEATTEEPTSEPTGEATMEPTEEPSDATPVATQPDDDDDDDDAGTGGTNVVVLPSTGSGGDSGSAGLSLVAMSLVAVVAFAALSLRRRAE